MKRLYRVEVKTTLYIAAGNDDEAHYTACGLSPGGEMPDDVTVELVEPTHKPQQGWAEALPYGSDDARTVAQLIEQMGEAGP